MRMMKNEEPVTLDDPITNETKEVPVVIIDWFIILKAIKKSKNGYSQKNWGKSSLGKSDEIFWRWRIIFPDKVFLDKVADIFKFLNSLYYYKLVNQNNVQKST